MPGAGWLGDREDGLPFYTIAVAYQSVTGLFVARHNQSECIRKSESEKVTSHAVT